MSKGSVDIINIYGGTVTPTSPNASLAFQVGNARSGEIYNDSSIHFRPAGLISLPVGPGNFDNSTGIFSQAEFSATCSQTYADETNSHWFTIGVRDTRNQSIVAPTQVGESRLFAEGNPKTSVYLDINGNIFMDAQTAITAKARQAITLISNSNHINLGSLSPVHPVALGDQTDSNFAQIGTALGGLVPITMANFLGVLNALRLAFNSPPTTQSTAVKVSA